MTRFRKKSNLWAAVQEEQDKTQGMWGWFARIIAEDVGQACFFHPNYVQIVRDLSNLGFLIVEHWRTL